MAHGSTVAPVLLGLIHCRKNDGLTLRRIEISMSHAAIEIETVAGLELLRRIDFSVHLNLAFDDEDEFLTRMLQQRSKFLQGARLHLGERRDDLLAPQTRTQVLVKIARCIDLLAVSAALQNEPAGSSVALRHLILSCEELGQAHSERLGDRTEAVVSK